MTTGLDLRTLELAAAAIETGSMSGTALRYGLTQSAVSQAVRRAEKITGALLLRRNRRPMVPTRAGIELAKQIAEILQRAETVVDAVRSAANVPERMDLRLGLADSFAGTVGPFLVKSLIEDAFALRLTAWSGLSSSHSESLLNHAVDVVVTPDTADQGDNFSRYPIFREPYVLIVEKSQHGACADLNLSEMLARHQLIRHSARSHSGMQVDLHLRRLGLQPPRTLEFDTSDAIISMVASGVGMAITTPLCLLQGHAMLKEVAVLPLPGLGFLRELALLTRREELVTLGPRIAATARRLMREKTLPSISTIAPWMPWAYVEAMIQEGGVEAEQDAAKRQLGSAS